jgi:hypothetical protein
MACACTNVGPTERAIRLVVGIGALSAGFAALGAGEGQTAGVLVALVGGIMTVTALIGFCPLYLPFKGKSCNLSAENKPTR